MVTRYGAPVVMDDPRIARTRAAVLGAAADLVVEGGPDALTVDAVVVRSGVAKSTIYRHWPTRDDLLVGVFAHCAPKFEQLPDDVPFAAAIAGFMTKLVEQLGDPTWARMMPALLLLKYHEHGVADVESALESQQSEVVADLFERGVREGALRPGLDHDEAIAHLVGPLVFALLTGMVPVSDGFAERTLEGFLAAYSPR